MSVPALSAAKTLCELRGWNLSNLELQKILYVAQMLHLGENHSPLINENFEAWDYGPVVREVYGRAKAFGSSPVRNVFHWVAPVDSGTAEFSALQRAVAMTRSMSPGQLVAFTHSVEGAWGQVYQPNRRGTLIPNRLIADEYDRRTRLAAA